MLALKRAFPLACVVSLILGLGACGGSQAGKQSAGSHSAGAHGDGSSSGHAKGAAERTPITPQSATASPATLVASVAGKPIRLGEVRHLMAATGSGEPLPDPPAYKACIARTKASQAAKAGEGFAREDEAQLKVSCAKSYENLLGSALSRAIHNRWLSGEAADEQIAISAEAVLREFDQSKQGFKSNAEFEKYRKGSGQSIGEMLAEIKTGKVADAIFAKIKAKEHPATAAEAAAYYDSHRKQFEVPDGRDLRILRTTSRASALNAKKELQSGQSFAQVAKQLSEIGQPIGAKEGQVSDLKPGVYEEKSLNDPIFAAKLNQLYGPLEITSTHRTIAPETNSGFFLYEVLRIVPGSQTPFSKVKASISASLSKARESQVVSSAIAAFKAKWTARTDCRAGYVVQNCKQYKGGKEGLADPFTL